MIAAVRYQLALLGHSQRYLPPGLAFLAVLGMVYADRNAPAEPEFAVSAGALTVLACWLTISVADLQDPTQQLITRSHRPGRFATLAPIVLTVGACSVLLGLISLVWAAIAHGSVPVGLGVLAHLAGVSAGIAVGLPCSRLLVDRVGYSVALALAALAAVLLIRPLPVVNPMLRALGSNADPLPSTVLCLAVSVVVLAVSAIVVAEVAERRG